MAKQLRDVEQIPGSDSTDLLDLLPDEDDSDDDQK